MRPGSRYGCIAMAKRTVMFCDVCDEPMEQHFTIIAWDLCPHCVDVVRDYLRSMQSAQQEVRRTRAERRARI